VPRNNHARLVLVGLGSDVGEGVSVLLGSLVDSVGQRELDLGVQELLGVGSSDLAVGDTVHRDDLDGPEAGTVATGKVSIQLLDGSNAGNISVLLVHVSCSSSGVVSEDNAKVLDDQGLLLEDLVDGQNLTGGSLDLDLARQEVPESRLGVDGVSREQDHLVDLGLRVSGCGVGASHYLILVIDAVALHPSSDHSQSTKPTHPYCISSLR